MKCKNGPQNTLQESRLYIWQEDGKVTVNRLYADNIPISSNDKCKLQWIKTRLSQTNKIKDLEELRQPLDLKISRNREMQ